MEESTVERKERRWRKGTFFFGCCLLLMVMLRVGTTYLSTGKEIQTEQIKVFVSILPQKYFVQRIGGAHVAVEVMVGPGQNPATYEPLPQQMGALAHAQLYFGIGVPFETAWIDKLRELNPDLLMIDTREGVPLRSMETPHHHGDGEGEADHHEAGLLDPHIWLDPLFVKIQAETICRALAALDPGHQEDYTTNLAVFLAELDQLHADLTVAFQSLPTKKLMVFHPAWGYLTDRYGLTQVPIEVEGKEPGPREMAKLIDYARAEGIRVIFIQSQFNTEAATAVARAVNGQVVSIDPLAEDYLDNLRQIAQVIRAFCIVI